MGIRSFQLQGCEDMKTGKTSREEFSRVHEGCQIFGNYSGDVADTTPACCYNNRVLVLGIVLNVQAQGHRVKTGSLEREGEL